MPINIDYSNLYSDEQIEMLVDEETKHAYYTTALERSRMMNTWYESEMDEYGAAFGDLFKSKEYIIKKSTIESDAEYRSKIERMRLFPLEQKFLSSQKRIYDENNVNRSYSDDTQDFWAWKEANFDDHGSSITEFFRDKVLFVKEVLGFGAVVTDLMMDSQGNTVLDDDGNVVPYNYIIRPHELLNFEVKQGFLTLLVTRQVYYNINKEEERIFRVFTPDYIYIYKQEPKSSQKTLLNKIDNPFGEVPATILRGDTDSSSSFLIGKPRRYALKGLYLAASELFYDLQQGSELFGHPIPVYPDSIVRQMAGVEDNDKYDATIIKESVGACIVYPDDVQPPNNLFYQADMQGLQHLRDVIFKDLMSLIFNLAQVRDKSVVKSNVSGQAKFLDNVEEQGLLAQTAMDMEVLENEVMYRMASVRGENPMDFKVTYSKHYDLSSANEIWNDLTEGLQYKGMNLSTMKYLMGEYLRKRSAPQDVIDEVISELEEFGMPKQPSDLQSLSGILPQEELVKHASNGRIDTAEVQDSINEDTIDTDEETGIDSDMQE